MTILDTVIIVLVVIFTLIGLLRGLIPQLFNLAGLVLAYFLASPLGALLEGIFPKLGFGPTAAHLSSLILAGLIVYFAVVLVGHFINKQVKEAGNGLNWRNRMWGGIIGLVKGILIALAILFIIDAIPRQLPAGEGSQQQPLSTSPLLKAAHRINPLPDTEYIQNATRVLKDAETIKKIQQDPDYQKLLQNQKFQDVLADKDIIEAIEKSDYGFLFRDDKLKKLVKDSEVRGLILKLVGKIIKAQKEKLTEEAPEEIEQETQSEEERKTEKPRKTGR